MKKARRDFQVFAKPTSSACNLDCEYCYYLKTDELYRNSSSRVMSEEFLSLYIQQHIQATPSKTIHFSWHGGEPLLAGIHTFKKIASLQHQFCPPDSIVTNSIQTNGILLSEEWCRLFSQERFTVGLSLDGPAEFHDIYRRTKGGEPTHAKVLRGYELLSRFDIPVDILCVVNAVNVQSPLLIYRYLKSLGATYIGFLPLVEKTGTSMDSVSHRTVPAEDWGTFLCAVFDEWKQNDIGKITIQMIEEALQKALGKDHALCIFKKTCGDVPVIEYNGDFYACDHFVDDTHRLGNLYTTDFVTLFESALQRDFGRSKVDRLPQFCLSCSVLEQCYGECPKNRFLETPDGDSGLNYLCSGYTHFFGHIQSFVQQVSIQAKRSHSTRMMGNRSLEKTAADKPIGRNDPCPCGSGKKFKKCCMRS